MLERGEISKNTSGTAKGYWTIIESRKIKPSANASSIPVRDNSKPAQPIYVSKKSAQEIDVSVPRGTSININFNFK
jgi:hypothetical protein